jgi:ribonuclease HI
VNRLTVTADGSCLGNPGPGGWAWVADEHCWAAGGHQRTTNNLMELRAVYELLQATPMAVPLLIQTDSSYVIKVFTEWIVVWRESGWRTSGKKPVANRQAIEMIQDALQGRDVEWRHVKGHAGHVENELADEYARAAATAIQVGQQVAAGDPGCLKGRGLGSI